MRIGVSCLQINPGYVGGVNSFTLGLLEGFASVGAECDFVLYVTPENHDLFARFCGFPNFSIRIMDNWQLSASRYICRAALLSGSRQIYKTLSSVVFAKIRQQIEQEVDLLYVPTVVLQFFDLRKPAVLSIHDIQHMHYPEFFTWAQRLSRRITYGLSAEYATHLQASSMFVKHDLLTHFDRLSPDRVDVIPEGVNVGEFGRVRAIESLSDRYRLPARFLFYPAQLWPHKNHVTVLKALQRIEEEHKVAIPLVLTGAPFSAAGGVLDLIRKHNMHYVQYLGKVPFDDLVDLYHQADAVIAAGLYESNCLPVLEAAAAGTPVIASRIPPNEELCRELRLNLFEARSDEDLARVILELWNDPDKRSRQSGHNLERVTAYSWANAARKYLECFARVLSDQRGSHLRITESAFVGTGPN